MRILALERFGADELLDALRGTRLRGHDGAQPYADASLSLVPAADPEAFTPAQNYVLEPDIAAVLRLRAALLAEDVDTFALDGGVRVTTDEAPDEWIPVIPPIVEQSVERDGSVVLVVNDGMHRLFAARRLRLPISTVVVRGVPAELPYYAWALPGGWADVAAFDQLPDGHQKKDYRRPEGYKALFRDFNAVFPGVQAQRRRTNPSHLVAIRDGGSPPG